MPEGDTIFRTARTLERALAGRVVTKFDTQLAGLAVVDRREPIVGRIVERVSSRGKHLLIELSGALVLRSHMRMHGSWHIYRPGERWRARVREARIVLATSEWVAIAFSVTDAELMSPDELAHHSRLSALGPDLLSPEANLVEARERIRASGAKHIAEALLAQRAVAGLGNVYKSELLFLVGLYPFTPVSDVSDETLDRLLARGRELLQLNVAEKAIAGASGHGRVTTGRLDPREKLWVYGRAGQSCFKCGTAIRSESETEGRRTYWCPTCQARG
ncbi:MAG: DNA-formamidopyrimidine glycosylase family protein [Acidobacteriota bacterium]